MRCGGGWTGSTALGLALDDEGFDFSVLSEFRSRLVAAGLERVMFDLLLGRLKELGLVQAGRDGSGPIPRMCWARIRDLNRLELAGETVRAALEALAAAAPGWLAGVIDASWQEVYGQRIDGWRLPASETKRTGAGRPVRPRRLPPAGGGPGAGRAGLAAGAARGGDAAPDLGAAVHPRRGTGG